MLRVGLVCDPLEERWYSMNLIADMLYSCLSTGHPGLAVAQLRPPMRRLSTGYCHHAFTAERLFHRYFQYPRWLRQRSADYQIFHLVDHSYAQLVHEIPAERTVITCHDLDTFRCILEPEREKRSLPFRLMTQRVLSGFARAARILCDSNTIRNELLSHGIVPAERVRVVWHGTHRSCSRTADAESDAKARQLTGLGENARYVLHVGSTIARKRMDTLLPVFAGVRKAHPDLTLVRVGDPFTPQQEELAEQLGIRSSIVCFATTDRPVLASIYRGAELMLFPSDAEGFGLPVVEAMACGCPVVASDIPVLREVGGTAAAYCPVADIDAWTDTVLKLLDRQRNDPDGWEDLRVRSTVNAARFSWEQTAAQCARVYQELV